MGPACRKHMSWRQNYLSVVMVEIIYRFACLGGIVLGYCFLGCPVSFCSGFNISLLIEQPSLLPCNNGNFDPGSYDCIHITAHVHNSIHAQGTISVKKWDAVSMKLGEAPFLWSWGLPWILEMEVPHSVDFAV